MVGQPRRTAKMEIFDYWYMGWNRPVRIGQVGVLKQITGKIGIAILAPCFVLLFALTSVTVIGLHLIVTWLDE